MEPLRKCQQAKQFKKEFPVGNGASNDSWTYTPCLDYPSCPYCPMALSTMPNQVRLIVSLFTVCVYKLCCVMYCYFIIICCNLLCFRILYYIMLHNILFYRELFRMKLSYNSIKKFTSRVIFLHFKHISLSSVFTFLHSIIDPSHLSFFTHPLFLPYSFMNNTSFRTIIRIVSTAMRNVWCSMTYRKNVFSYR